jgi:hypothetical protein
MIEIIDALEVFEVFTTTEDHIYEGNGSYRESSRVSHFPSYTWEIGSVKGRSFYDTADEARKHAFVLSDLVSIIDLDGTLELQEISETSYALRDSWGHFTIGDQGLQQLYYIDSSEQRHKVLERVCEAVELDGRIEITRDDVRYSVEALGLEVRA